MSEIGTDGFDREIGEALVRSDRPADYLKIVSNVGNRATVCCPAACEEEKLVELAEDLGRRLMNGCDDDELFVESIIHCVCNCLATFRTLTHVVLSGNPFQKGHHLQCRSRVQPGRRFIKKQYAGAGNELLGHTQSTFLPARDAFPDGRADERLGLIDQPERPQDGVDPMDTVRGRDRLG